MGAEMACAGLGEERRLAAGMTAADIWTVGGGGPPPADPSTDECVDDDPDMFGVTRARSNADRLLRAAADIYSRWFSAMRSAVSRGRANSGRGLYQPPQLTDWEESVSSICEDLASDLFGDKVASYATHRFRRAVLLGDMRSFKIRLLVLKSRDSLKGTYLHPGFCDGAEDCISEAESMAGCVPDPSPRRMSNAERRRAEARELSDNQPSLFGGFLMDWEPKRRQQKAQCPRKGHEDDVRVSPAAADEAKTEALSPVAQAKCGAADAGGNSPVQDAGFTRRKARPYSCVSDIEEDIAFGRIKPYESQSEILDDMSSCEITAQEAVLFMAELRRRLILKLHREPTPDPPRRVQKGSGRRK